MSDELKNLIENTSNREGLARLLDRVADRLDEIVDARRRERAPAGGNAGGADG